MCCVEFQTPLPYCHAICCHFNTLDVLGTGKVHACFSSFVHISTDLALITDPAVKPCELSDLLNYDLQLRKPALPLRNSNCTTKYNRNHTKMININPEIISLKVGEVEPDVIPPCHPLHDLRLFHALQLWHVSHNASVTGQQTLGGLQSLVLLWTSCQEFTCALSHPDLIVDLLLDVTVLKQNKKEQKLAV